MECNIPDNESRNFNGFCDDNYATDQESRRSIGVPLTWSNRSNQEFRCQQQKHKISLHIKLLRKLHGNINC